jgi:HD-GYP domain-containing protein (c-di-GMP phosphodiesterase class II)
MELGFDETAIEGVRVAAVLHDVGKIAVPTDILVKPGRLQDYEYDIVKLHVERGYEILAPIDFEWPIAQIVLQHHERMDGSGYPAGLKGGQILLEARILAVADTLDAMTTHRPYRAAESLEVAVREIMSHRHLYDTEVAEGLERAIDAGRIGG